MSDFTYGLTQGFFGGATFVSLLVGRPTLALVFALAMVGFMLVDTFVWKH